MMNAKESSPLRKFADETALTAALQRIVESRHLTSVSVGVHVDGKSYFAAVSRNESQKPDFADHEKYHCGCIAKCLTSMLVAKAIADRTIALTDDVWSVLGGSLRFDYRSRLSETTIDHLLNHTHGLDDSLIERLPPRVDEFIDVESLCARLLEAPALAPSGELFSYSSAGIWLAAAILERLYKTPYARIMEREIFQPLRIVAQPCAEGATILDGPNICPATGDRLKISVMDLLKIGCAHLRADSHEDGAACEQANYLDVLLRKARAPGVWKPKVRRICLGWNDYGDGWYGHNAKFRGDSVILRFSPREKIAMVIAARQEHAAYVAFGGLFGKHFDEFRAMSIPRRLSNEEWSHVRTEPYLGTFANAAATLEIGVAADRSLKVSLFNKSDNRRDTAPSVRRRLAAADDGVFFAAPADVPELPFVQFVHLDGDEYRYLFSNQRLFRRIG